MKKTLITFNHFDRLNDTLYKQNLDYFIRVGLINSEKYHFNFVINSETGGEQIPKQSNVSIIKGCNKGRDFGAYKESVESININKFDYFIFMNDTCRGPLIPTYVPSDISWVDMFLKDIDDEVKMVGPTWFIHSYDKWLQEGLKIPRGKNTHIQTYCFGVDREALNLLL